MKKGIILILLMTAVVISTISYPTPYHYSYTSQYAYVFYQTDTNTTLNTSITKDSTTVVLNDATGFSTPGVLYFPETGEIMHINSISGNTVTVNRAQQYNAGTGRFDHSAGETVVFAHLQRKTGNTAIKLFQDSPHVGDFVMFAPYSSTSHILESINFKLSTTASYTDAEFEAYEINSVASTYLDMEYYKHQIPMVYRDGTKGFTQNGTMTFDTHESGFPYYYNIPLSFYNRLYDESNAYDTNGFWVVIKLKSFSGWTTGPTLDMENTKYYEKTIRPTGETGLTWEAIANADFKTPLQLADETQGLFRQPICYDEKSMQLKINVTGFSAAGEINISGLTTDESLMAYFPFTEGKGWVSRDYANYRDFLFYPNLDIKYGYGAERNVTWVDGQHSGKKAMYFNETKTILVDNRQKTQKAYPKLSKQFSVEVVFKPDLNQGMVFGIGENDAYTKYAAGPVRLVYDSTGVLKAQLTLTDGTSDYNYYATYSTTAGNWYYAAVTYDGSTLKLYINGTLVNSTSTGSYEIRYPPSGTGEFFLWGGEDWSGNYFKGAVSETAIWTRVLSSTEISERNTKQEEGYLQEKNETINITANGEYLTQNRYSYITSLDYSGTYNFKIYQPRLNVIGVNNGAYQFYVDFGLDSSTFSDATGSKVIIGNSWPYNLRAMSNTWITSASDFQLGELKEGRGINGGTIVLWNTNAQGTYRNYLLGKYYGTKLEFYNPSIEVNTKSIFKDCIITALTADNNLNFNGYNFINMTDWTNNKMQKVYWRLYSYYPFYNSTTLQVMPDENWDIVTDKYHGMIGLYYQGGWHKGVKVGTLNPTSYYDAYFYHYNWKEVMVNPQFLNNHIYVYPRTGSYAIYGSPTFGYTLKLKIVDDNGNPVQGAKVEIKDADNYSAIFIPPGYVHPTVSYIYGDNYGTKTTSFTVNDASNLSVGDIIDVLGERMNITAISTNTITVDRGMQNTDSYSIQCYGATPYGGQSNLFITKQQPYLITNASGEIQELIIYTDYYKNTTDKKTKNPLTITVTKDGYEPLTLTFNLTEATSLIKELHGKRSLYPINARIISGTTYSAGDTADLEVEVLDENGQPVDNATCSFTVYYPDKTTWLSGISTTYLNYGVYYNNSNTIPSTLGVYTYSAKCDYGSYSAYASKYFQVR